MRLQKGFRRFAPIIKARKAENEALEAARPGGRYDRQFWGWGSNGNVFEAGVRSRHGPWDVSRIAEGEVFTFKLERGKLSFLVVSTCLRVSLGGFLGVRLLGTASRDEHMRTFLTPYTL